MQVDSDVTAGKGIDMQRLLQTSGVPDLPLARAYMHAVLSVGLFLSDVLAAMAELPRHCFLPACRWRVAYLDLALNTPNGWLFRPCAIAGVLSALTPRAHSRVLEIGTGPGYQTALLALLHQEVVSTAFTPVVQKEVSMRLRSTGIPGTHLLGHQRSLRQVVAEYGLFDQVIVNHATTSRPEVFATLVNTGGQLLVPVVLSDRAQRLMRYVVKGGKIDQAYDLGRCAYPVL
jgi:protein-L-isoaspartate(D-aspartate) O-methyltransferase